MQSYCGFLPNETKVMFGHMKIEVVISNCIFFFVYKTYLNFIKKGLKYGDNSFKNK